MCKTYNCEYAYVTKYLAVNVAKHTHTHTHTSTIHSAEGNLLGVWTRVCSINELKGSDQQ
jgi:hypothetical protein